MDYKEEYENALERAKKGLPIDEVFPELRESEDERIRKLLVWQVYRNIEDETNDLAQSVYDGIKGHDPDIEESIEDWKKCLAYLEKQKEQKPAEWSEEDERMLEHIISDLREFRDCETDEELVSDYEDEITWLKSLRPQPRWKPSEEQVEALKNSAYGTYQNGDGPALRGLYEQLEKMI